LGLPNPSPKLHLKYVSGVSTSRVGHTTNQPFGMHLRHVRKLTLLASSFGAKFPQPQKWSLILIWAYARSSICPMPLDNSICLIQIFHDTISWKFLKPFLFHLQLDVVHFMKLRPTKRKVMSSSRSTSSLCRSSVEFFYGFLGMFHVGFIHPRCLYYMVAFPLN